MRGVHELPSSSASQIPRVNVFLTITGKPDPVANCSVSNTTHSSFLVSCQPGFDGGLTQVFTLNVFKPGAGAAPSILNMTSKLPSFQVKKIYKGESKANYPTIV